MEQNKRNSFMEASPTLRGDKVFMREVLKKDPSLFSSGTKEMQVDFDLAIIAFANSPRQPLLRHAMWVLIVGVFRRQSMKSFCFIDRARDDPATCI